MAEQDKSTVDRRRFIRIAGASVVTGSLAGLVGCGGGDSGGGTSTSSAPTPEPAPPAPEPTPAPATTAAAPEPAAPEPAPAAPAPAAGEAPRVSEDDPVASSLGYKHDAADVDLEKHPKRGEAAQANAFCKNCVLFQGKDGDEWGPCSIFGGKLVNANGWCATYAPKG